MAWIKTVLSLPTVALVAMVLALGLVRIGVVEPITSFGIFMVSWVLGGVASTVAGTLKLYRGIDARSRAQGRWQVAAGILLLIALVVQARSARVPPIHDITTNPIDPPQFSAAAELDANHGRDMTYPHGGAEVPGLQAGAYPDLVSIRLPSAPDGAQAHVIESMQRLGWTVTWSSTPVGLVEATHATSLFRFVDDIVVRIRAEGGGSVVDVRSLSRVGRSDLGANAARIRALRGLLGRNDP